MPPTKTPSPTSRKTNISVSGDVDGNIIVGDNNTVNQTIIQKFFNIFKSDAETVDQRNRRIMLGHVENFWVKGILEKSLHGAALLDLGIKEDPNTLNYPWAIKREANKETLPEGTSMLDIFQEIGMGRSLLILGAPGSGKTTMLLELTRQLIEHAREDVTEPIPVVFNLSSWTEKLTLADWLARELNTIYYVPKKVAPTWVKENKMLLLLDGLDEVKHESRDKCVDAINQFRKENGLTSMAVCSRIQDYAELKTQLFFEGAIEIQPLTASQVDEYFKRFGEGLVGIRHVLEKDTVLREMAETPLFLSIMTLGYRDTESKDILVSENLDTQRKHLFDTYIWRMFERPRLQNIKFKKQDALHWLSWLAYKMTKNNQIPYMLERMQPRWLGKEKQTWRYKLIVVLLISLCTGYPTLLFLRFDLFGLIMDKEMGVLILLMIWVVGGRAIMMSDIQTVDIVSWSSNEAKQKLKWGMKLGFGIGSLLWLVSAIGAALSGALINGLGFGLILGIFMGIYCGLYIGVLCGLFFGFRRQQTEQMVKSGQGVSASMKNSLLAFILGMMSVGSFFVLLASILYMLGIGLNGSLNDGMINVLKSGLKMGLFVSLLSGLLGWLIFGGAAVIQHYSLRLIVTSNNHLPWKLISFLDYCVDLIFLRRVGGGYIFVHRLLMEHFAAMYQEGEG